jgi:hypothetical protein
VERIAFGHRFNVLVHGNPSRPRAAAAGALAATVWGLLEPLDQRLFRCAHSDVDLLGRGDRRRGLALHGLNGAVFGLAFDEIRRRTSLDQRRLALGLALAEHLTLWPLMAFVRPELVADPRAFAQSTARHALFGALLGRLA